MQPVNTAPNMQSAASAADVARPKAKVRQKAIARFPYQAHAGITVAMNRSLERLTGGNALLAQADVIRMALHGYLLQNDPAYHRELGGNRNA